MSNFYQQNINLLCKFNPAAAKNREYYIEWAAYHKETSSVYKKENKFYFKKDGKEYQLFSCNPKEEAKRLAKEVDRNKEQILLVFGMGNIELLRKLLIESNPGSKIVVMEPNMDVFAYCMNFYNLREFITSDKFLFLIGNEILMKQMINVYFSGSWVNLAHNIVVISLLNYHVYQEFKLEYLRKITNCIDFTLQSLGNSLNDMLIGLRNHYQNIDACIKANSYKEIKNKYKGYPAIIVASGPSLDKNIHILKQAQGKALIISCDASYVTCVKNGVLPDAIASLERGELTYEYFFKDQNFHDGLVLVGPSLLWPKTHEEFPGKQLLFAKNYIGTEGWWSKNFENIEFLSMGHSCATAAYGFAREAGCDPVILIGQDLAYTDDKKHSVSVHDSVFTAEGSNNIREDRIEQQNLEEEIWTEDIYGNRIRTSAVFNLFRSYFETCISNTIKLTLVDATEGGAKIKGSIIMTLQEAINKYCVKEIGFTLNDLLEDKIVTKEMKLEKYNAVIKTTEAAIEQIKYMQSMAVEHFEVLKKYNDVDFEASTTEELAEIVLTMQKGNKIIDYIYDEGKDIVSYYQQILRQSIINVKRIGNALNGETVKKNLSIQRNLMYMIDIASAATANLMIEMLNGIDSKKKLLLEEKND